MIVYEKYVVEKLVAYTLDDIPENLLTKREKKLKWKKPLSVAAIQSIN